MNQQLLIQLSEGMLFFIAGIALIIIFLASMYDLRLVARRKYLREIVATLPKSRQLHVTVLVRAKNNAATIEACLHSISLSNYKNYDIVVVDNVSVDTTKQVMASYKQKHPTLAVTFFGKQKASNQLLALQQGYEKSQKGDVVLVLDATSTIAPTLLGECIARFVADDTLAALRLNEHIKQVQSITLLWLRFMHLSRNVYAKSASLLATGHIKTGESSVMYRHLIFTKKRNGTKEIKTPYRYDGSLVVPMMPAPDLQSAFLSLPTAWWLILSPVLFLLTYFWYVATSLQSSSLLILSWLIIAIWLLTAVLSDEAAKFFEKIGLVFYLPSFYFLLYAHLAVYGTMTIARGLAVVGGSLRLASRKNI